MKKLLIIQILCLLLYGGCSKKVEVNLDEPANIPELTWELPEGWKAEQNNIAKIPWQFIGPEKSLITLMKLKDADGFVSIWAVTKAWRQTLDLKKQSEEDLKKSLSYAKKDVISYKIDNGVKAVFGAFYSLNGNLWVFRYSGSVKDMREADFDSLVASVSPNEKIAEYIEQLKEIDDPRAFERLAGYYARGVGVKKDIETAKKYFRKGREAGDHDASHELALFALKDDETDKAVEYLSEGIKAKHVPSLKTLAGIVLDVRKDYKFAGQLLKDAADRGDTEAMYYLASLHLELEPENKKKEIVSLINTAAYKNYMPAAVKLAEFHLTGYGVEKNSQKAIELLEKGVALKHMEAVEMLAHLYYSGKFFDKDAGKALNLLFDAAALGSTKSMITLSSLYFKGEGVEKSNTVAFDLLEQAARSGDGQAMLIMGDLFYNGLYTQKNHEMAFKLFKQSALAGNSSGMYKTGQLLLLGEGVEIDQAEGVKWLKKAAAAGNEKAGKLLKGKNL